MKPLILSPLLLVASNIFMTFAWYGHLKNLNQKPWIYAALISWLIALFEYLLQVPANRLGFTVMSLGQLKIMQEVITLCVFVPFAILYMNQPITGLSICRLVSHGRGLPRVPVLAHARLHLSILSMKYSLLGILILAAALPARADDKPAPLVPLIHFEHRALNNGLQIYSIEDHSSPMVAIAVWYHVGSKDDPKGRSGFAHLFEHMMFKGTQHMKPEMIDRLTEDVGGMNNAFTTADVTVFHELVPSNYLEPLLWAEAERMSALTVSQANFVSERAVVEEEFRQRVLAEPYGELGELIEKKSFAVHPYKRPTIGNIAELEAAKLKDVIDFHRTFYRPDNATLVVVGDFEPKQFAEWSDKYFGPLLKPTGVIPRVELKEPERKRPRTIVEKDPKVPLPALALTYLGPSAVSDDCFALELAEEILAGGESSRLYQALVYQQQLASSVSFDAELREDLGLLAFKVVLASGKKTSQAEAALLSEIKMLRDKPVGDAELAKARNRVLTRKLRERETFEGKAMALGEAAVLRKDAARLNNDLNRLVAVNPREIKQAISVYMKDATRLVIDYEPKAISSPSGKGVKP